MSSTPWFGGGKPKPPGYDAYKDLGNGTGGGFKSIYEGSNPYVNPETGSDNFAWFGGKRRKKTEQEIELEMQAKKNALTINRQKEYQNWEIGEARKQQEEELAARMEGLLELIEAERAPALVRAAIVHAEMLSARPFTAGNAAVGRLLVRHLLVRDGVEPTGTAVSDLYPGRAPGAYAEAAGAYASGTMEGVAAWVVWQAEAVLAGVQEAQRLCRAVQAGTWRAG